MGGRVIGVDKALMHLGQLQGRVRQGELGVVEPPLHVKVCFDYVLVACASGTFAGLMMDVQPFTHRLERVGGKRAATVRDQGLGDSIAETGRIKDHQRGPGGFGGRYGSGQDRPRVSLLEAIRKPLGTIMHLQAASAR